MYCYNYKVDAEIRKLNSSWNIDFLDLLCWFKIFAIHNFFTIAVLLAWLPLFQNPYSSIPFMFLYVWTLKLFIVNRVAILEEFEIIVADVQYQLSKLHDELKKGG